MFVDDWYDVNLNSKKLDIGSDVIDLWLTFSSDK